MAGKKGISVYISFLLRHKPEDIGLLMDKHGWVETEALIQGINKKGKYSIDKKRLEEIVAQDQKGRYRFNEDHSRIKACQGHSIPWVEPELKYGEPPEFLYHGTTTAAAEKIMKSGAISKMSRHAVHMQEEIKKAWQSAKRWHLTPVVLKIDAKKMYQDGFSFGVTENEVWCTETVPANYIVEQILDTDQIKKNTSGCNLCPRECGADRKNGKSGYCGVSGASILGARAALHMWEEPCISGEEGSGTVFFSGCPLRCVYCQNYEIAHAERGAEITVERLAEIFMELQDKKANNINLVTPTHYSGEIIHAVRIAREQGLRIPIVYNCSGYEKTAALKMLEGTVDIYLTDFKYMNPKLAKRYSNAEDYPEVAKAALHEMVRQCGRPEFDERGMMIKGVIVRHLLLPGQIKNAKDVVKYVYVTYGDTVLLSLMNQYTPLPQVAAYPEINRKVTDEEYDELVDFAIEIGVENGFIQEGETAAESFIPAFDNEGWN